MLPLACRLRLPAGAGKSREIVLPTVICSALAGTEQSVVVRVSIATAVHLPLRLFIFSSSLLVRGDNKRHPKRGKWNAMDNHGSAKLLIHEGK